MSIKSSLRTPLVYYNLLKFSKRAADYRQQEITLARCYDWLRQFPTDIQYELSSLLGKIFYFSEKDVRQVLRDLHENLINRLSKEGIPPESIIYVTLDDPGSSSHLMFNLLRDETNFERRGFRLCDHKNVADFVNLTTQLGSGAIVYVDDFSASGKQFLKSRNHIAQQTPLIGSFSEFFLLPCICSEAHAAISKVGVSIETEKIHHISDRPLHPDNRASRSQLMQSITEECRKIDPDSPIGFDGLATMIVLFTNTPNTTPKIFRGFAGQQPKYGIIPRAKDRFADGEVPPNAD